MASISWSTPIRRAGSRTLSPIPNEIYLEIFDYFKPSDQTTRKKCRPILCNLALVCHFFCAVAVPRIFSVLEISGQAIGKDDSAASSTAAFCRAINQGKEPAASLAGHVKQCELRSWHDGGDVPWVISGFLDMYIQAMKRMPNLHALRLVDVTINKRLLKAICGLKGLTSLCLQFIKVSDNITEEFLARLTPLELTEFTYFGDMTLKMPTDMFPKIIARIVSPRCLKTLWSVSWKVNKEILGQIGEDSALVHVDIFEAVDDPILWRVLERSKNMRTLRITSLITGDSGAPATVLPASSMPKLEGLLGPPSLLYLVPGRPLRSIELSGSALTSGLHPLPHEATPMGLPDIARLKGSSVHIRVLNIPTHLYFLAPLAENFPFVEALHVCYDHANYEPVVPNDDTQFKDMILALAQKWPPNSSIRQLHFDLGFIGIRSTYYANLELQYSMIAAVVPAFPNLDSINFVDYMKWSKVPFGETWRGKVEFQHGHFVHHMLQRGVPGMRDYDGIFEAILNNT